MRNLNPVATDRLIIGGWCVMLAIGQLGFNREVPPLEWAAVIWVVIGMWRVRRGTCLPLLVLTCPAFMSEIHRPWAVAQVVMLGSLLARVVLENRFSRRQWAGAAVLTLTVLLLSWPRDAARLLQEYGSFPFRDRVHQLMAPEAVWAVFPFRQALDRSLVALLVLFMAFGGRYLVSHRVWQALFACALATLAATYGSVVLPWQEPHLFLGTTNHGFYRGWLFHGAGYNVSYFALFLNVGLFWMLIPLRWPGRWIHPGYVPLLIPVLLLHQRAFYLSLLAGLVLLLGLAFHTFRKGAGWRRRRVAYLLSPGPVLTFAISLGLALVWFNAMGVRDVRSRLSRQLAQQPLLGDLKPAELQLPAQIKELQRKRSRSKNFKPPPPAASKTQAAPAGRNTGAQQQAPEPDADRSRAAQLEKWLQPYDPVRAHMWSLGLKTIYHEHVWRGAGAGTWARFHKQQPRPFRAYLAHMHNTYLDVLFEYGIVPVLICFSLCLYGLAGLLRGRRPFQRLWLYYLIPVAVMGLGQHLLYAFTNLCFLVPALLLVSRGFLPGSRPAPAAQKPGGA